MFNNNARACDQTRNAGAVLLLLGFFRGEELEKFTHAMREQYNGNLKASVNCLFCHISRVSIG